jgi:serine/threonine protein kinase
LTVSKSDKYNKYTIVSSWEEYMGDRTGQQIGNYQLVKLLGRGGFAEVYLGEQIYLKTQAAIKLLQHQLEQKDLADFLTEARIIANLTHPNIVRVLEFGEHENTPYLVMDYAPAGTLRNQHPHGSQLSITQVVSYVRQIAAALQYAHDNKIIHRDVKPENMLMGRNGEILLSDFGIAVVSQSSRSHGLMEVGGTIAYMAPEQLQGKAGVASDQYALAIVVYEWLTGTRPFNGSFTEIGTQHIFAPPPSVRKKVPSISAEVDYVLQTALAKDPRQRYASIQAFADALQKASLTTESDPENTSTYVIEDLVPTQRKTATPSPDPINTASAPIARISTPHIAAPVSPPSFPDGQPKKPFSSHQVYLIVIGILVFLLIGGGLWSFFALNKSGSTTGITANGNLSTATISQHTSGSTVIPTSTLTLASTPKSTAAVRQATGSTPIVAPTPTPIPLPTPTQPPAPTPTPVQNTGVLYSAGGSNGWSGWNGTSEWFVNGNLLMSRGADGDTSRPPTITAPYSVTSTNNYAVEARVQIVGGSQGCFFLAIRSSFTANGWSGYKTATCTALNNFDIQDSSGKVIAHANFTPGNGYHVYRIEVDGSSIRCYVDGGLIVKTVDASVPSGSQVGIKTHFGQIAVSDFQIIGL